MSSHASISHAAFTLPLYISIIFHVLLYHYFHKSLLSLLHELCDSIEHMDINFYCKSTRFFLIEDQQRLKPDRNIERCVKSDEAGVVVSVVRSSDRCGRGESGKSNDNDCQSQWRINSSSDKYVEREEWTADYIRQRHHNHRHCLSDTQTWNYPQQISSFNFSSDNNPKYNNNMNENESIVSCFDDEAQDKKTQDTHKTFKTNYDIIR